MIGYKLFRRMRDGYAPLFINKRLRLLPGFTPPRASRIARAGTSALSLLPHT